jgi:predicted lactoylglutathione lyase
MLYGRFFQVRPPSRFYGHGMQPKLNVITLGVDDVARARAFYEQLGWTLTFTDGDIAMFQAGPMIISLWGREKLAHDSGVSSPGAGWGGFTLGYAVADADAVDAVFREATAAGATVTRAPGEMFFGYSGVFADLDGHTWEIMWVRALTLHEDGSVEFAA